MKRLLSLLLVAGACAPRPPETPRPQRTGFAAVADSLFENSDLSASHWGIEVFDPAGNQRLYSYNADRHFIPASNTKLVVTSAAMGTLGPDYRYRTEVLASQGADNGSPERVVIVGRGDPTWSGRFKSSDFTVLEQLADSLSQKGIRSITRELIIDASFFGADRVNGTWEVGDLTGSSAPPSGAFVIGEGVIQLEVLPSVRPGEPAKIRVLGPQGVFPIRSTVITDTARSGASLNVDFQAWPDTIVLSGRVGRQDTTTIAAPNATRFAASALVDIMVARGIQFPRLRIVYDSANAAALRASSPRSVFTWTSEPLSAITAAILQPSQNWIAEQLLRTLGGLQRGRGSWGAGLDVERRFLIDVAGLDSTSFSLRDASGLSAQNLLSPNAIVRLLEYDRRAPWADLYRTALPTPGQRGSTLSTRFQGLEGKLFAKTGTISNVASLSGYVTTRSGRLLIFAIMVNASGRSSAQVRRGIDRLVVALVEEW